MARIRTIKPEFPQSESMGRVSRDARLLFVMLWPICDDHGRTRAASRMLASTLFPYDEDARALIGGWLDELERECCIRRYEVGGSAFLEICNWLTHQRIDKPSKPQFPEPSCTTHGTVANSSEDSSLERKGKEGKGKETSEKSHSSTGSKKHKTSVPSNFGISERVRRWAGDKGVSRLEERFEHFVGHARAKGYTYVDWDEALMNAIRDDWAKLGQSPLLASSSLPELRA